MKVNDRLIDTLKVFGLRATKIYVTLYRIHGFLLTELTVRKAFQSYIFHLSIERAAMKTQYFANI